MSKPTLFLSSFIFLNCIPQAQESPSQSHKSYHNNQIPFNPNNPIKILTTLLIPNLFIIFFSSSSITQPPTPPSLHPPWLRNIILNSSVSLHFLSPSHRPPALARSLRRAMNFGLSDVALQLVMNHVDDPCDRDAVSLVCRKWYKSTPSPASTGADASGH